MLAYFLGKLKATPDGDGNLLDHSMILYGSSMSNGNQHDHDPLPLVLAGGASGQLEGGRHMQYAPHTPVSNLLLAMLDKLGVHQDSHGDSTGETRNLIDPSLKRSQPMEPTKPKLPSEAVELYNLFIHGEISRRAFMDGVQRFAVGGLAAATIIEALMPNYALGQQVSKTDDRIKASYETVPSPQGNGSIKGYLVRPVSADTREATAVEIARHYRRPRKSRSESAYRGHRAAARPRQLHGVCAGRTHLSRRLSR